MTRQRSSLGLFGVFGRSEDLKQLDSALRSVDLHPRMVPEAVKLTVVRLMQDHAIGAFSAPQAYRAAAEILGYCMIGAEGFAGANDVDLALRVGDRIERAMEAGDSLDAQIVLVTMTARVIQPSVVERFELTLDTE
ncbi:conserved hypothetical protein [Aurantimonas manganoxydans SI85-9A1]|uniref:Uncharacterized protein n=1 Tax=Aurantimonas manganoxydans (strain ATCC BAA-1229 / DSM 21871 / SI85-9A1) TaxID=287752 RepID=Q1YG58_AURMS|nr:hypothetical protein [Aurantimonas manganoxydans]EAS49367.1 conserved hypothetical protein [Aurantimonas manganoxydans SI85-9A1]